VINDIPKDKQLILFDGVCNLCNTSVLYIIKRDRKDLFLFAPLQSEIGNSIINAFNIDTLKTDSILLYQPQSHRLRYKSSAALHIVKHLTYPAKFYSIFFIIPNVIRDWAYDIIAKNRYNWFGKKSQCMVPTPNLKAKFLN
jgi:predicted DCC family thiol-disulfide oxidoreductase YuxK